MPRQSSDHPSQATERQKALSRWDNEGGASGPVVAPIADEQIPTPDMSNADMVALRVRGQQLELAREMADYISPRPGFTHHPLTIHAAAHMIDLIERSSRFR